jgi:hypothetical protein
MTTPAVIEVPLRLEPVTPDTFIDELPGSSRPDRAQRRTGASAPAAEGHKTHLPE